MIKFVVLAIALSIASAVPLPLGAVVPGGAITSHHHTATSAHHGIGYGGYGGGLGGFGYHPVGGSTVVKHSEVASAGGYPAAVSPYGAYGYPGLGGLGYGGYGAYGGFPAAKAITQVTTTAVRPGFGYGYY